MSRATLDVVLRRPAATGNVVIPLIRPYGSPTPPRRRRYYVDGAEPVNVKTGINGSGEHPE